MTYKMGTAYGTLYVTINEDDHGPFEVFATMGKAGGFFGAQTEAITRLISTSLRSNIAIEEIIEQLKGIRGPDVSFTEDGMVYSLPDAIAKVLEKHTKRNQLQLNLTSAQPASPEIPAQLSLPTSAPVTTAEKIMETVSEQSIKTNGHLTYKKTEKISIANLGNAPVCPTCANMLIFAEGCMKCDSCGYSKCG
jgi:ribonucleoside-diphosphate reductase alpha chain